MLPGIWSGLGMQPNYTYIDQNGLEDQGKFKRIRGVLGLGHNE
jgi:hypothetical protein